MQEAADEKFMRRCLDLAVKAEGMTYPNPMVGAVVVHDNAIIGEGYHLKAGGPHAEVFAVGSVSDKKLISSSTLYVSLEPCSHYGKTPPCADLVIESGIPRIVIGAIDTSLKVSGKGVQILKAAGREVITGVLGKECREVNRRFFTYHEKKRPYITLKWAQSADGFIDTVRDAGSVPGTRWITGLSERVMVHKWRAQEEAILIGAETSRLDSPGLDVRLWSGRNPLRIVLSNSGKLGISLTKSGTKGTTIAFTGNTEADTGMAEKVILSRDLPAAVQVTRYLYDRGIQSLFIEGGAKVLDHFIGEDLWDEARIFTGKENFVNGVRAPVINGVTVSSSEFNQSKLDVLFNWVA